MAKIHEVEDRFVSHLEKLRAADDRAALARLRRGLGKEPGTAVEMFPLVQPWLPANMPRSQEDAFFLVAALFAAHPEPGDIGNFGQSFARLAEKREIASIEKRFVALLNAHKDDLANHLRHAVSLLASDSIPVNWRQLLADIQWWGHPERFVQRDWAKGFWGGNGNPQEPALTPKE
jgi:CRISPR system Cascade subunit CasB